jgi:hypothetical protein
MAACAYCGVVMATNERNINKRGGAAALHVQCTDYEDLLFWAQKWFPEPGNSFVAQLNSDKTRYSLKKAGSVTMWP